MKEGNTNPSELQPIGNDKSPNQRLATSSQPAVETAERAMEAEASECLVLMATCQTFRRGPGQVFGQACQPFLPVGGGGGGIDGAVGILPEPDLSSRRGGGGGGGMSLRSDIISLPYSQLIVGKSILNAESFSALMRIIQRLVFGNCGPCFSISNSLRLSSSKRLAAATESPGFFSRLYHNCSYLRYKASSSNDTLRYFASFFRNGKYGRATSSIWETPMMTAQTVLCRCQNDHAATLADVQKASPTDSTRSYWSAFLAHSHAYKALNLTSASLYQILVLRGVSVDKLIIPIFCLGVVVVCFFISGLPFDLLQWWSNRRNRY